MKYRWFYHPILIFIFSVTTLAVSLALYIYWYIEVSAGLSALIKKYHVNPEQFFEVKTWVVIVVLSILVALILMGIFLIFVYNQKTWKLYRLQRNFINSFTHELKTPVTSLKLYLDTFEKHQLSREEQIRYIGFMIQDTNRLLDNIDRILSLAGIESGSFHKEFMERDLVDTVKEFYRKNRECFRNCDITIRHSPEKPVYYPINPTLFEMLLMNITTNAVKYNESAHPRVNIHILTRRNDLQLCFEDNGIGIDKSEIGKIFRKFYRSSHIDGMTAHGTGLGLYLVKQIAKIHKGKVKVESDGRGKGAKFTLSLPLRIKEHV